MTGKSRKKWFVGSFAALLILSLSSAAMAGQASPPLTGAIFTTKIDGIPVNSNIYDFKEDVYLNGGPQPNRKCDAAGLPNGIYYFQVTDPSGKTLLSSDLITDRMVEVKNGVFIDGLLSDGSSVTKHSVAQDDPNIPIARCNGVNVQLAPFENTPNPGGEYKVWITRESDYSLTGAGVFGFLPSKSKTDNFKVVNAVAPEPERDTDGDGVPDGVDECPDQSAPETFNGCLPPPPPA